MSAGRFTTAVYEAKYGTGAARHPILVQPETLALTVAATANASSANQVTNPISASVGKGRRENGLHAALVSVKFDAGDAPEGYEDYSPIRLPALTEAFRLVAIKGARGVYLTKPITVIGTSSEEVN